MSLKSPKYKIQASFACFEFACKELIFLRDNFNWLELAKIIPDATGKNIENYQRLIDSAKIAIFGYHVEIMQQGLEEYIKSANNFLSPENNFILKELQTYLYLLRCALLHTEGELVPTWQYKQQNPTKIKVLIIEKLKSKGMDVKIPCITEIGGFRYNEKSNNFKKLNFKIHLKKDGIQKHPIVYLNKNFINKLRLLSWHVLTITKKRKYSTLCKYLNKTSSKIKK